MKASEAMLRVALEMEGVHEVGFNNRGPQVEEIQRADDLPGGGYAWCVSFKQFCADLVDFKMPSQTASVGFLQNAYAKSGWIVAGPQRGAEGFWQLDDGTWPDHLITVEAVLSRAGSSWTVRTIEGNTSKGIGSTQDGGGAYRRTRVIDKRRITWGLAKGNVPAAKVKSAVDYVEKQRAQGRIVRASGPEREALLKPTAEPPDEALYWLWLRWKLGEGDFRLDGPSKPARRPKVLPKKIPQAWHRRAAAFVKQRKHK